MPIIIKAENLSKSYNLGTISINTLRNDIWRHLSNFKVIAKLKQDDNRLTSAHASENRIWALKNFNVSIEKGEILGIIGKNGAGKSTLLKLLSRITSPSTGSVMIKGRIASLLEIGTGFHPDLTGRENIYMNGSILGLRKKEIASRLDMIIDFSGVEKFIDTPVKRYSSGMYVRLAFSIAAHLEPEILIVDEVLAVGDAQFQKKCLGKLKEVSSSGDRTVLFVSHNMPTIENLCTRGILLESGEISYEGSVLTCVNEYIKRCILKSKTSIIERTDRRGVGEIVFSNVELLDSIGSLVSTMKTGSSVTIRLHYMLTVPKRFPNCRISCAINSSRGLMFVCSSEMVSNADIQISKSGFIDIILEEVPLSQGSYSLTLFIESRGIIQDWIEEAFSFEIIEGDFFGFGNNYPQGWNGNTVLIKHSFSIYD